MGKITVWTKQHINVLHILKSEGRYTAKKEFVQKSEEVKLIRTTYDWLVEHHPDLARKPVDADYPVWVSFRKDAVMLPTPNTITFELELDCNIITYLNVMKWTAINNFSYIPKDEKDEKRHKELLKSYCISDAKAYMSQFYPEIKREIEDSWIRLFDENVNLGNDISYGLIWEIKKEWVKEIIL